MSGAMCGEARPVYWQGLYLHRGGAGHWQGPYLHREGGYSLKNCLGKLESGSIGLTKPKVQTSNGFLMAV